MVKTRDSEIHWGVIGAGDVCRVKSAPAMNKIKDSRMVAVMRRDSAKAKAYAVEHNVPRWYDSADDLLADPEVNAIYIATPPHLHLELTRKSAASGKPVYVEKPMARTHQECMEMITVCEDAEVPLYVAYYRRALPNYLKILELVDSDVIGDVRSVHIQMNNPADPKADTDPANWRLIPEVAGGGYFYDLACHQLDFLDFLFGPIIEASGLSVNQAGLYEAEDLVTGTFRFSNGVLGTGSWNFAAGKSTKIDRTTITGSKGEIAFPTFSGSYVDLVTDVSLSDTVQAGSSRAERFEFEMPQHIQQPLIQTIVNDLLKSGWGVSNGTDGHMNKEKIVDVKGECPSTGITAARTNLIMEKLTGNS